MLNVKNEIQQKALLEFQKLVQDLNQDEATCIRFLTAREFKVDQAEQMLRNALQWRADVGIENYYLWNMPDIRHDFEFKITGENKDGGPVLWLPMGLWQARYWVEKGRQDDVVHFGYHILESLLRKMKEMENKQSVVICGMETLTYYKVAHVNTLKCLYSGFQVLEMNYPEILQSLIIVNAPWVFSIAFNVIKPILSPRTMTKLKIFGSDKNEWLPVLKELMPVESIPKDYLENQ